MEYRLVIKDYNNLYIIYLTKLYKVLIRVILKIIIIFNFYIYKELFGLINFIFKGKFKSTKGLLVYLIVIAVFYKILNRLNFNFIIYPLKNPK